MFFHSFFFYFQRLLPGYNVGAHLDVVQSVGAAAAGIYVYICCEPAADLCFSFFKGFLFSFFTFYREFHSVLISQGIRASLSAPVCNLFMLHIYMLFPSLNLAYDVMPTGIVECLCIPRYI